MGEGGIHKWTGHLRNNYFYLHMNRTLSLHRKSIIQLRTILHWMTPLKSSMHVPSDSQVLIPRYWFSLSIALSPSLSLHISIALSLIHTHRQTYRQTYTQTPPPPSAPQTHTKPSNNRHSTDPTYGCSPKLQYSWLKRPTLKSRCVRHAYHQRVGHQQKCVPWNVHMQTLVCLIGICSAQAHKKYFLWAWLFTSTTSWKLKYTNLSIKLVFISRLYIVKSLKGVLFNRMSPTRPKIQHRK